MNKLTDKQMEKLKGVTIAEMSGTLLTRVLRTIFPKGKIKYLTFVERKKYGKVDIDNY